MGVHGVVFYYVRVYGELGCDEVQIRYQSVLLD